MKTNMATVLGQWRTAVVIFILVLSSAGIQASIAQATTIDGKTCPGSEIPGNSTNASRGASDTNKCYKSVGVGNGARYQATNNTPTGGSSTTPATGGSGNSNTPASGASSDYAPDSSGKCKDGSDPTVDNPTAGATPAKLCAASTDTSTDDSTSTEGSPCAIEKIGWILCPIIESSAKMADWAFDFLANNFLQVEPELLTANPQCTNTGAVQGGSGCAGTITAWEYARNLANIMFVIAFVIVIYSQITGAGLNNYGIKRMLPRLIIAAIAVNISYYICQIMVDLSNLLGYNIKQALSDISLQIGPQVLGQSSSEGINTSTSSTGGTLATIAIAAIAVAGVIWVMLPVLGSIVAFILITCIVIIIILLLRKAFIILLVVMSPIAFVAYLLPNTEKYFSKWLNMFWQLLMVFPIIALLLGAGQLASTIILVAGTGTSSSSQTQQSTTQQTQTNNQQTAAANTGECGTNTGTTPSNPTSTTATTPTSQSTGSVSSDSYAVSGECTVMIGDRQANWTLGLVAAGVAIAPLLAVWSVLQGALSAAGAIGGKITSAVSKGANSSIKGTQGGLKKAVDRSAYGVGRDIRRSGKEAYKRRRVLQSLGKTGDEAGAIDKYRQYAAGGLPGALQSTPLNVGSIKAQNQAIGRAASARDQIESEEVKNELTAIEYAPEGKLAGAQNAFDNAITGNDEAKAKAATAALMSSGEAGISALAQKLEKAQLQGSHELAVTLKEYIMQAHGNVKEKNAAIHAWATSGQAATSTVTDHANNTATYAKLSDAQFATQTEASLGNAGAQTALRTETRNAEGKLETRGHRLLSNPENAKNFSDAKRDIIARNGGDVQPH